MKLIVKLKIMRKLRNMLKSRGELAMKIMTNHREANSQSRMRNHKYNLENYPSHQSGEYALV